MIEDSFYKVLEDKHRGDRETIKDRLSVYLECIKPLKILSATPKVLDLGCGRGEWLELLKDNGFNAFGVDIEKSMIDFCKQKNFDVEKIDMVQYLLSVPQDSLDLITGFHIAEHLEFDILQKLISLSLGALKNGGLLILETPNPENILVASKTFYMDPTHKNPLPPELLKLLAEYQGFFKVKVLRLQEPKNILTKKNLSLSDIFNGVSPDYSIIAQKSASKKILDNFNQCFDKNFGVNLDYLLDKYEQQSKLKADKLEKHIQWLTDLITDLKNENNSLKNENNMLFQEKDRLERDMKDILNSNSWKLTKPLRVFVKKLKSLAKNHMENENENKNVYDIEKPTLSPEELKIYYGLKNEFKKKDSQSNSDENILAYLSPLPPQKSGISFYSSDLIEELKAFYKIELIVPNLEDIDKKYLLDFKVRDINYFLKYKDRYSRVVYHFGNSGFHSHMFDLVKTVPGVVVFHDFYLSHMINDVSISKEDKTSFANMFYMSHGYKPLTELSHLKTLEQIIWKYPCNYEIIQNSLGIISHSAYQKELVKKWYFMENDKDWYTIALLRKKPHIRDKNTIKAKLSIPKDTFVVCSFGYIGSIKLSQNILYAWISSCLNQENCMLIFVGEGSMSEYGLELKRIIKENSLENRVYITGWVSDDEYIDYLNITDMAVQLRINSRGETSASVLDCMNYSLPVIVNRHGAMKDLSEDSVFMIGDNFKNSELTKAMENLYKDREKRDILGKNAAKIISDKHNPAYCASMYAKAIESSYTKSFDQNYNFSNIHFDSDLKKLAKKLALSEVSPIRQRQILVDISSIVHTDLKTGIQRVVRSQLKELIENTPNQYRVEAVYLKKIDDKSSYFYANNYMTKFLNLKNFSKEDSVVKVADKDIFYGLDLAGSMVVEAYQSGVYDEFRAKGVKMSFVVYDLLPILYPHYFPLESKETHERWLDVVTKVSDMLISISDSVSDEVYSWIQKNRREKSLSPKLLSLHLGANLDQLKHDKKAVLPFDFNNTVSFLMVGTVEPRKGYIQSLDAFEILWQENMDINLIIVGKRGWMMDSFIKRLENHHNLNKKLFWLEGADDVVLEKLYRVSASLIVSSEAEGFGLPLIEAARHKLPIIARDIPVFKEVAKEHAYYFKNSKDSKVLADGIKNWIKLYKKNSHPKSDKMPYMTWRENVIKLLHYFDII